MAGRQKGSRIQMSPAPPPPTLELYTPSDFQHDSLRAYHNHNHWSPAPLYLLDPHSVEQLSHIVLGICIGESRKKMSVHYCIGVKTGRGGRGEALSSCIEPQSGDSGGPRRRVFAKSIITLEPGVMEGQRKGGSPWIRSVCLRT